MSHFYVVRADELSALNYLPSNHPRPISATWINRGTNRLLRKQSVDLLLRTLFADILSESVVKLHRSSGLRVEFRTEADVRQFGRQLVEAKAAELESLSQRLTVMFDHQAKAFDAVNALVGAGIPKKAVSILWRAGQFMDSEAEWVDGHSVLSVAGATAGGSVAGLALGVALIAVPGLGQVAAAGGFAVAATNTVPAIAGIFGATAAAIGKMLSDADVDDVAISNLSARSTAARIFVTVEIADKSTNYLLVRDILRSKGGQLVTERG